MEKLIYVLWRRPEVGAEAFCESALGEMSAALIERGAIKLAMNLDDGHPVLASAMRLTRLDRPMSATVSIWMNTALDREPIEAALRAHSDRLAGYLVVESVPLVNTKHVVTEGERTPGYCTVAFLELPAAMTYDAWLERWQGHHTRVAIETQSTFLYIQNVIVRAVTADAPPWTAIVEEGFPEAAATDPMVFYAAGGDPEKLKVNQHRMFKSCETFIDFNQLESHPLSQYVLRA